MSIDNAIIKEYKDLLNNPQKNENDIQNFLENHTQLIPLPIMENHGLNMNVVISKFRLGNEAVTDFAYLTKSSNLWRFVMIELENQHKTIFKKSDERPEFSAEFNIGLDQIRSWKVYINENKKHILRQIEKLRQPLKMSKNPIYFEYVLIIGRDDGEAGYTELTEKRRKHLANFIEESGIKVMSYDSIARTYINFSGVDREKVVLSPWREQGYSIKNLPKNEIDTSLFTFLSQEYLKVSKKQEDRLVREGYEINEWRKGFSLAINEKYATDSLLKQKFRFDGSVVKV